MKLTAAYFYFFALVALAVINLPAKAIGISDDEFLVAAKSTLVSQIDSSMPDTSIEVWLASILERQVIFSWEIVPCDIGRISPESEARSNLPICAMISASNRKDDSILSIDVFISFQVGTSLREHSLKRTLNNVTIWGPTAHENPGIHEDLSTVEPGIRRRLSALEDIKNACPVRETGVLFSIEALSCIRGAARKAARMARSDPEIDEKEMTERIKRNCRDSVRRESWIAYGYERVGGNKSHTIDTWPDGVSVPIVASSVDFHESSYWSVVTFPDDMQGWVPDSQIGPRKVCVQIR